MMMAMEDEKGNANSRLSTFLSKLWDCKNDRLGTLVTAMRRGSFALTHLGEGGGGEAAEWNLQAREEYRTFSRQL